MSKLQKSYWSVIPAEVRYSEKITDGAKLLYSEITCLCNDRGYCWAGNDYFAQLYKNDVRTVSRWIGTLAAEGFVYIDAGSGKRKIFLAKKFAFKTDGTPIEDEPEDIDAPGEPAVEPVKKKKKPAAKKEVEKKYTDIDLQLAEMLLSKILLNFPMFENKTVKISEWAEDIRKLREIDKATPQQIGFMICWLQGGTIEGVAGKPPRTFEPHEFWSKNIMSTKKLRKQWFENLVPQLQTEVKKIVKKSTVTQL